MLLRNFGQPHWYKTVSFRSLGTQQRAVGNSRDMLVMAASKQQLLSVAPMYERWWCFFYFEFAPLLKKTLLFFSGWIGRMFTIGSLRVLFHDTLGCTLKWL